MKKLILTVAIILGLAMGSFAQNQQYIWGIFQRVGTYNYDDLYRRVEIYDDDDLSHRNETDDDNDFSYFMVFDDNDGLFHSEGGGLFRRGAIYGNGMRDGGTFSLCLPGHNFTTNWNGGSQGHDDELLPLGSGTLLLVGFGAAYALSRRKKED